MASAPDLFAPSHPPPIFILGISGPSSVGKTTLAHLLSHVLALHVRLLLHGDDFCKELDLIPTVNGYLDADGPQGVDFDKMVQTLDYVRRSGGNVPEGFTSWQGDVFPGQEERALRMVEIELLAELRAAVKERLGRARYGIVIMEGFLLYHREDVRSRLDGKLFVRLDHEEARCRRLTRPSYGSEAKEGEFWKTEDYFEKMVWRNYAEQHAELFEDGDVEGNVDKKACHERQIAMQDGVNVEIGQTLRWAVEVIIDLLQTHLK